MLEISQRGQQMPMSPYRKLTPYADAARQRGTEVYHLNIGQPDIETPPEMLAAVREANIRVLEYSPSAGSSSYRQKLAAYYQRNHIPVQPDDILVTAGGSEAIFFAFMSCLNPGDEVVIPEPFYGAYISFAIATDVRIVPVVSTLDEGFALPPIEAFERVITPRTKAIMVCNPSNPTGYVYSEAELLQMLSLCQRHNLFFLSDEAYREYCYEGFATSALQLPGAEQHVVMVDTISKRYSACGARLGALVTKNPDVQAAALKFAQMRVSAPALAQLMGEAATDLPDSYFEHTKAEYRARRDLMVRRLRAMPGVACPVPGGAFYVMARLPVDDAGRFGQWLLEEFSYQGHTVMVSPAAGFYVTPGLGRDEVRLAYVLNLEKLDAALDCLEQGLAAYPGRRAQGASAATPALETRL